VAGTDVDVLLSELEWVCGGRSIVSNPCWTANGKWSRTDSQGRGELWVRASTCSSSLPVVCYPPKQSVGYLTGMDTSEPTALWCSVMWQSRASVQDSTKPPQDLPGSWESRHCLCFVIPWNGVNAGFWANSFWTNRLAKGAISTSRIHCHIGDSCHLLTPVNTVPWSSLLCHSATTGLTH
jgi:hypothetical protein